jgi:hypothetical protein
MTMHPLFQCAVGVAAFLLALLPAAEAENRNLEWRTFRVPNFGTSVQYPASVFAPAGDPEVGTGQRLERADGRAVLSIYSRPNERGRLRQLT